MIVETVCTYLLGYLSGLGTAAFLVIYFLSSATTTSDYLKDTVRLRSRNILKEESPTDESRKILDDAVHHLINVQTGRSDVQFCDNDEYPEINHFTLYQLEQTFHELCNSSKDRGKQLKTLASFIADIGRAYAGFAKDLTKLSLNARSYVKSLDGINSDSTTTRKVDSTEGTFINEWWAALSLCLEHLSNDTEKLSEQISQDFSNKIIQTYDDQHVEDKKLCTEGTELLTHLKDSLMNNEPLVQERDKWRIKVSSALQVPVNVPVIGGMTLTQSDEENNRRVLKLQSCELALLDSIKKVNECKNEFKSLMPKIFSSFRATGALTFIRVKMQLMNLADSIENSNNNSSSVTQRLKSHISATSSISSAVSKSRRKSTLMGFEPMLQQTLKSLSQEGKRKYVRNDESQQAHTSSIFTPNSFLNMALESTACLAASPPTTLPPLPACFKRSVGLETCVWFNAFSGRVYRDAARSQYFHCWLLDKLTNKLNKGNRPGFVDEFTVESVSFGSAPPLIFNVQWSPPVSENMSDEKVGNKRNGSGSTEGIKKKSSTKSSMDFGSASFSENSVSTDTAVAQSTGTKATGAEGGEGNSEKFLRFANSADIVLNPKILKNVPAAPNIPAASVAGIRNNGRCKDMTRGDDTGHPSSDGVSSSTGTSFKIPDTSSSNNIDDKTDNSPDSCFGSSSDDDVECTADIAFRSGLKFKISSRLWCNWPMDHCASIPISLTLELVELTGRIRFGVAHSNSFISFLEEPHTRFLVHSEVGSETFKFKDIPKLSEYIIKKLKSEITKKVVHPNVHSFRLVWPRNWWPEDAKTEFVPSACPSPINSTGRARSSVAGGIVGTGVGCGSGATASGGVSNAGACCHSTNTSGSVSAVLGDEGAVKSSKTHTFTEGMCVSSQCDSASTSSANANDASIPSTTSSTTSFGDSEEKLRTAQSAAAAVLASFSSTTEWIKGEVRGFKITQSPFRSSTPPIQMEEQDSQGVVQDERSNCEEKEGICMKISQTSNGNVTGEEVKDRLKDILEEISEEDYSPSITNTPFPPSRLSLTPPPENSTSQNESDEIEVASNEPLQSTGGLTPPPNAIDILTIKACEEMNFIYIQSQLEKEKIQEQEQEQETEDLEKLEMEKNSKKWYEKIGGATELLQNKFSEIKNKVVLDATTPSPPFFTKIGSSRSRSTSESNNPTALFLSSTLSDLLTPISGPYRRSSSGSQVGLDNDNSQGITPSRSTDDHDTDSAATHSYTYNSTKIGTQGGIASINDACTVVQYDDHGIIESGAVCVDKENTVPNVQPNNNERINLSNDLSEENVQCSESDDTYDNCSRGGKKKTKVNFQNDNILDKIYSSTSSEKARRAEFSSEKVFRVLKNVLLQPQEKRYKEFRLQREKKREWELENNNRVDSFLKKGFETPISPLLYSLSLSNSPPYSPHRNKEYLIPDAARLTVIYKSGKHCQDLKSYDNLISRNSESWNADSPRPLPLPYSNDSHSTINEYIREGDDRNIQSDEILSTVKQVTKHENAKENAGNRGGNNEDENEVNDEGYNIGGSPLSFVPFYMGLVRAPTEFPTRDEMWAELSYGYEGKGTLKLYLITDSNNNTDINNNTRITDRSTIDTYNLSLKGHNNNSSVLGDDNEVLSYRNETDENTISMTLAAVYSIVSGSYRPATSTSSGGMESTDNISNICSSNDLIKGQNQVEVQNGTVNSNEMKNRNMKNEEMSDNGDKSLHLANPVNLSGNVPSYSSDSTSAYSMEKMKYSPHSNNAKPLSFGFEIWVTSDSTSNLNTEVAANGVQDPEALFGVTKESDNAVVTEEQAKKDRVGDEKEVKEEGGKWVALWCDNRSDCASWLTSLQTVANT